MAFFAFIFADCGVNNTGGFLEAVLFAIVCMVVFGCVSISGYLKSCLPKISAVQGIYVKVGTVGKLLKR